jgi:hypothetical protein
MNILKTLASFTSMCNPYVIFLPKTASKRELHVRCSTRHTQDVTQGVLSLG